MAASRVDNLCACLRENAEERGIVCTVLADGSGVLLDVQGGKVMSLNPLAVFIWVSVVEQRCAPSHCIAQIASHYEMPSEEAEADAVAFLESAAACLDCRLLG